MLIKKEPELILKKKSSMNEHLYILNSYSTFISSLQQSWLLWQFFFFHSLLMF